MPILIRDKHLENEIDRERVRRQDGTMAKTLGDLARERLTQIERDRLYGTDRASAPENSANSADSPPQTVGA